MESQKISRWKTPIEGTQESLSLALCSLQDYLKLGQVTVSIVQTLFGFWQAWCCDYFLGEPAPVTDYPPSEAPFHNAQSELPCNFIPCPWVLLLVPRERRSARPPLLASPEASPKLCFASYLFLSFLTQFLTAHFTFTCKASAVDNKHSSNHILTGITTHQM